MWKVRIQTVSKAKTSKLMLRFMCLKVKIKTIQKSLIKTKTQEVADTLLIKKTKKGKKEQIVEKMIIMSKGEMTDVVVEVIEITEVEVEKREKVGVELEKKAGKG